MERDIMFDILLERKGFKFSINEYSLDRLTCIKEYIKTKKEDLKECKQTSEHGKTTCEKYKNESGNNDELNMLFNKFNLTKNELDEKNNQLCEKIDELIEKISKLLEKNNSAREIKPDLMESCLKLDEEYEIILNFPALLRTGIRKPKKKF